MDLRLFSGTKLRTKLDTIENKLLDFVTAKDPLLEMLQWMMDKFMEIEVAHVTFTLAGATVTLSTDTAGATVSLTSIQN